MMPSPSGILPRASATSLRASTYASHTSTITAKSSLRSSRSKSPEQQSPKDLSRSTTTTTRLDSESGIRTLRYEEATQDRLPIPVTVPPPRLPPREEHPAFRERGAFGEQEREREREKSKRDHWRDSGLCAPPTSSSGSATGGGSGTRRSWTGSRSVRSRTTYTEAGSESIMGGDEVDALGDEMIGDNLMGVRIDFDTPSKPQRSSSVEVKPTRTSLGRTDSSSTGNRLRKKRSVKAPRIEEPVEFHRIETDIPTESLLSDNFLDKMTFSNRGSVFLGGKKAVRSSSAQENGTTRMNTGRQPSFSMLAGSGGRLLPLDVEMESQKVMSMYEQGAALDWETMGNGQSSTSNGHLSAMGRDSRPTTAASERKEHELAGGIEDWEDVNGLDVDRYGFISSPRQRSSVTGTPEPRPPQRVSTVLQLVSEAPRKHRGLGRALSTTSSPFKRDPNRKTSSRSLRTNGSSSSTRSNGRIRAATNRLPGNKDRRCLDEAGDMLTLPPGLADIAEDEEGGVAALTLKRREWERAEKWRKMAKVIKSGALGEGQEFEFDTKNPRLIERVWKGIPDRWRSAAWYSFMATSAKKHPGSAAECEIKEAFRRHLGEPSADDVQIDIDVPRTINSHIMFRRRYRGGQRLLFRVLHCLSLYFPNTGYVQGMASLAATLLCYFDEEKTFVMLVRMWTLRGLARLYEAGFEGLMTALEEFQTTWLERGSKDVADKLNELGIEPTAYGTRWYLTLFNYSIPFPAQLRVWDVFLLLGDADPKLDSNPKVAPPKLDSRNSKVIASTTPEKLAAGKEKVEGFGGGLDVIHATAAAIIDAERKILLDSDFENSMKVLTSWVPVKDEEMLMRVVRVEWKGRGRR